MKSYDRGARFRAALAKQARREHAALESTPNSVKRVERQYAYNYLSKTLSILDANFGYFTTDEVAYNRGLYTLSKSLERALRSPATPKGTRRAMRQVQALVRQFSV